MKRLKNILLSLRPNDTTYKKMYEGKLHMLAPAETKELSANLSDPVYWNNGISYKIERTNRLEPGKQTIQMLTKDLPKAVEHYIRDFNVSEMKKAVLLYNKQQEIRQWLKNSIYCSFIADGSILPREQESDLPIKMAKPFTSTYTERILIGNITGMGIRKGVTVITGGGYSGKSTLLDAIAEGIYNHVAGDGREYVITDDSAVNISAEDGRSIRNIDISAFIQWIPGKNSKKFSTDHASGSTSQAANIVEVVNDSIRELEEGNLDDLYSTYFVDTMRWLEMPRANEVLAVIHRMKRI